MTTRPSGLTPAQGRVLDFLDAHPGWHGLEQIDQSRLLEDDDVLCIPSLVERKLVFYIAAIRGVAITPAGSALAPRNLPASPASGEG